MTRKAKILIAVAFVAVGVIAWTIWPVQSDGELKLNFSSNRGIGFTVALTNTFPVPIQYFLTMRYAVSAYDVSSPMANGILPAHSATNHMFVPTSPERW